MFCCFAEPWFLIQRRVVLPMGGQIWFGEGKKNNSNNAGICTLYLYLDPSVPLGMTVSSPYQLFLFF